MIAPVPPQYFDAGETALVVQFGTTVDEAINDRVLALDAALAASGTAGIVELVPTYRSLMVHYDPLVLSRASLIEAVKQALVNGVEHRRERRLWAIPACYDPEFAEDIEHVAAAVGLSTDAVIASHASARYRVFMYGFAPGFAYLGGLPKALTLPRRTSPRDMIPVGSLIIAGGQALVSTIAMPSGWHILGRTPERLFSPQRAPAFLVSVGDLITFERVERASFDRLNDRALRGELVCRSEALP